MINIRPFKGYRPEKGLEDKLASKPYDVIDHDDALEIGKDNPYSYLHVIRPEIDLPTSSDPYSEEVYEKAKENLEDFIHKGYLMQEDKEVFYIYRQILDGREQNGIVACISIDDYGEGRIKKHELTKLDKEEDRINNFYYTQAHTEPVFLFYKRNEAIKDFIKSWTETNKAIYDFTSQDGVRQILWLVDNVGEIAYIQELFASLDELYIADGHHRTASSYKVGQKMRQENPDYTGQEEFNYFMSVVFPDDELYIMPYNRVIKDLNGYSEEKFLEKIGEKFNISPIIDLKEPRQKHEYTMILRDRYYTLTPKEGIVDHKDVVKSLDVSILQDNILEPILGIKDPRTDNRLEFYGGKTMLDTIVERLSDDMSVAFLLYPTQIDQIIKLSDEEKIMPPKSTWFEPKLMSGLFVHRF